LIIKSINLIVVNIFIGILITLCLSNLVVAYQMAGQPGDRLSKSYEGIGIGYYAQKIYDNDLKLSDLIAYLDKNSSDCTVMKTTAELITGVYKTSGDFIPNLVSGRGFTRDDFLGHTNVVLLSEHLLPNSTEINGTRYYLYQNQLYQVVGVYRKSNNKVNVDSNAYYNLNSENIINNSNFIEGSYVVDSGDRTEELVNKINDFCGVVVTQSANDYGLVANLQKAIGSQIASVLSILLIVAMVAMNSISIASSWINNRRQEIYIRRMSGASSAHINRLLIRDYLLIMTGSFVVAFGLAMVISNLNMSIFIGYDFSIVTLLIAYLFSFIVAFITLITMLISYSRQANIAGMLRG